MKANPAEIFNYAIESLPDGETFSIDCENESQLNRIRMALYRQRNKLEKVAPTIAATITISKRVEGKSHSIIIGKNAEHIELFTFDNKGNKVPLVIKSEDDIIQDERLRKFMIEDGKSKEEIEEYFQKGRVR